MYQQTNLFDQNTVIYKLFITRRSANNYYLALAKYLSDARGYILKHLLFQLTKINFCPKNNVLLKKLNIEIVQKINTY